MIILGIETSCDETGAAVLSFDSAQDHGKNGRIQILSNIVASSASLQAKYGGVIPEQAAREQIKSIIPVIEESLRLASLTQGSSIELDAIAVTYGPGLIGSLLVGVETAKTLSLVWNKPLIPINHLIGHFYANWIEDKTPTFPCIGLLVSGGHTDLVLFTDHGKYEYLGGTRDDAAGECFDKCARLLGLPYPGGPEISKLATKGDALRFNLPRPMIDSDDFDFSFSGLKTAVARIVSENSEKLRHPAGQNIRNSDTLKHRSSDTPSYSESFRNDLAASIEQAIVDVLVKKTIAAAQKYKVEQIMVAGGVAANEKLVDRLQVSVNSMNPKIKLHIPPPELCTDNAAMTAAAGFFEKRRANHLTLQADPNLSLSY
ncbi:tRNA (adenosine(37)-N6)-threonylcarbamoyltransferase complex transferase subunit TsaD [Candidatus Microgenomates bacterium]|nr:tRNA (adenosine(37)-N6)-threonylcarbamoyltransferase complex transferase subunit TsaD [Candidatus Microgenomates bacterium]